MEDIKFFDLFFMAKDFNGRIINRLPEKLYGICCGLHALETGDFSILLKPKTTMKHEFLTWADGVFEAVIIRNGNGDMTKTVSMVMKALMNHLPIYKNNGLFLSRLFASSNYHLLNDHFDAFFRFYRELASHCRKMNSSPMVENAVFTFIEYDKDFKKISLFNEILMPLILQFRREFIKAVEEKRFDNLFSKEGNYARSVVKYMVHIAKYMDQSDKKRVMAHINTIDHGRKFIRVRGVRRKLKQIFGQKASGINIYHEKKWTPLNEKQQISFEKPCKIFGKSHSKVILEIEKRQYLFSIKKLDKDREIFYFYHIKKKIKPEEVDFFFADDMI